MLLGGKTVYRTNIPLPNFVLQGKAVSLVSSVSGMKEMPLTNSC